MTRKERDAAVAAAFEAYVNDGLTRMQATEKVQNDFGFLTPVPVYNARRRVKQRKGVENDQ